MEAATPAAENTSRPPHRRNASSKSNILRSLVPHKTRPTEPEVTPTGIAHGRTKSMPFLPPDHPHAAKPKALAERQGNVRSPPPSPSKTPGRASKGTRVATKTQDGSHMAVKSKSSTNLGAVFARLNRSSKDLSSTTQDKNKENKTPPDTSDGPAETPIWAQFASGNIAHGKLPVRPGTSDSNSSGQSSKVYEEIARYTPQEYSPSKQRNFNDSYDLPSLRPTLNSRPQSTLLYGEGLVGAIGRKVSDARASFEGRGSEESAKRPIAERRSSGDSRNIFGGRGTVQRKVSAGSTEHAGVAEKLNVTKRSGRVMAAVAAFQGRAKTESTKEEQVLNPKSVEEAFEAVLDSRNIPEPMRQKMRSLTMRVKQDFIKQDLGSKVGHSAPENADMRSGDDPDAVHEQAAETDSKSIKRSRGRTFTFSKGDKRSGEASPSKKPRSQSKNRPLSINVPKETPSAKSPTRTPSSPFGSLGRKSTAPAVPADYLAYLKTNQDPTKIEVGRLHKLRILLRNETVAWVDSFVSLGGMAEIVGLLYRTMAVEWREEHEDQLLHETLLCLKGLCTTERAMTELQKVADDLFPALLGMLFDDEKKGPAEYTTRTIIINVLFNFLAAANNSSSCALEQRARKILAYLGEPQKPEDARPVDFVLDMHTPRPYKLWSREVSNVTREVFWIFLHHLNIIPAPKTQASDPTLASTPAEEDERKQIQAATYTTRHFPGSRPPVPAAPYIGGVEWDATTYIAAHLDLLNGLLASIPLTSARNALRADLLASGFEKVMGSTLRTCKEKFYSGVHDGLKAWVAAATEDGWATKFVREGPTMEEQQAKTSPTKKKTKKDEPAPRLEVAPLLDLKIGNTAGIGGTDDDVDDGWLG